MSKYTLLIILNLPFVIFGIAKTIASYKKGAIRQLDLIIRLTFWITIFLGLVFAEPIYNWLFAQGLTDSTPLSIADVVLVTGLSFCLFLIIRLYAKIEAQQRRFANLHEKLSILLAKNNQSSRGK